MSVSSLTEAKWNGFPGAVVSSPDIGQAERIAAVFGVTVGGPPPVSAETLARYYRHLSANLSLPFTAYYPQPTNPREAAQFRCTVLELLDPTKYLGDEFDGIFCKTRRGRFEVNLPLVELYLPQASPDFQLVEDFGFWFWNWR
jgi:hypothetical protein